MKSDVGGVSSEVYGVDLINSKGMGVMCWSFGHIGTFWTVASLVIEL